MSKKDIRNLLVNTKYL